MAVYFTETYPEVEARFGMRIEKVLFSGRSEYQKIEIFQSARFGKVLVIDDCIMLTELDEFIYHEMIAHVALHVHPGPENILVIGGGDGGTVREIIKHPDVAKVTVVDIDKMVTEAALNYLPEIASALLSEKVTCLYEDGVQFVRESSERYDLILIDSTDPISVGEGLFTRDFYQQCHHILRDEGILVNQAESPFFTRKWLQSIPDKLGSLFSILQFYHASIPTYPSGYWMFGFASKKYHPVTDFRKEKYGRQHLKFRYYNDKLHEACFVLPNNVREIIERS